MSYDSLIVLFLEESLETDFDTCLNFNMLSELGRVSVFENDIVFLVIFVCESIDVALDRKSTRLNSSHNVISRMPSSA